MRELQRFSLLPILKRNHLGLGSPTKNRGPRWPVVLIVYVLPIVFGAAIAWVFPVAPNGSDTLPATGPLLPVLSVSTAFVGGFLACFVLLMNLRFKLAEARSFPQADWTRASVSQAAYSSLYLMLCSGLIVVIGLPASVAWPQVTGGLVWILQVTVGLIAAIYLHMLPITVSLVRRVGGAYSVLFDKDLSPRPHAVSESNRSAS